MGNRAVITASKALNVEGSNDIGVYLHWNGGRDNVEAFLEYCKLQGFRSPDQDCYGWARLVQVIANYFGSGGLSVGIEKCHKLDCDNYDNGVYIIKGWEIVDRQFFDGSEQNEYDRQEMLLEIDQAQPEKMQLGEAFIKAPIIPIEELFIGDRVYKQGYDGRYDTYEIVGIGKDEFVNGQNVKDMLYIDDIFMPNGGYSGNINNYLRGKEYRVSYRKE